MIAKTGEIAMASESPVILRRKFRLVQNCGSHIFKNVRSARVVLALGLVSVNAFADHEFLYRWVDSTGDVQFSDIEPQNRPYDLIAIPHAPPADPEVQRRLAEMDRLTSEWAEERNQQAEAVRSAAELEASRKEGCARAREQETELKTVPYARLLVTDDAGNAHRMTDTEQQERLSKAMQQISELCTTGE
jgi:hypothetical protein